MINKINHKGQKKKENKEYQNLIFNIKDLSKKLGFKIKKKDSGEIKKKILNSQKNISLKNWKKRKQNMKKNLKK